MLSTIVLPTEEIAHLFDSNELPYFRLGEIDFFPGTLPLLILSPYRSDLSRFFQEVLSSGRKALIETLFYTKYEDHLVFQAHLFFESKREFEAFLSYYPVLEKEMRLGMGSLYHAKKLIESKGMIHQEKGLLIQEKITMFLHRYGRFFDFDIYDWMQKFLLQAKEGYKKERSYRVLLKIIAISYIFLGALSRRVEKAKTKRHLFFKLIRIPLETPFGSKETLGFFIALNFVKANEIFERKRFIKIIQRAAPGMRMVENSLFQESDERLFLLYVEMEKEGEETISEKEIHFLKKALQDHLQGCIENLVRPLFMPRNEEEVMKYLVTLGGQLHTEQDLPQIVVLFDEQTDKDLFFTVVLVRPHLSTSRPLEDLFPGQIEKTRVIGYLHKKTPKEAGIVRLRLPKTPFLRQDFAVDLYKARQRVVKHLIGALGPVRDYNGGMIARQMEALDEFKHMVGKGNSFVTESFFHALSPPESRLVAKRSSLKDFYDLFLEVFQGKESYKEKMDSEALFLCIKLSDPRKGGRCSRAVQKLRFPTNQLVRLSLPFQESLYLGYLLFSDSASQKEALLEAVRQQR